MPFPFVAAAIAASGIASAVLGNNAAKKAANAATEAADKNAEVNREIYQQTRTDLQPYNQAGQQSLNALMVRLGLQPTSGAPGSPTNPSTGYPAPASTTRADDTFAQPNGGGTNFGRDTAQGRVVAGTMDAKAGKTPGGFAGTSPLPTAAAPSPYTAPAAAPAAAPTTGGQPDYAAYGAANPDLQAEWQRIVATGNAGNDKFQNDPNKYYEWHANTYGVNEGRTVPTTGGQPAAQPAPAPVDPNAPPPVYAQETYAPRPEAVPLPTYTRAPDMAPPPSFSYSTKDIENDVGYKFARDEALNGVNAFSAARGNLRSGDAAKALVGRAAGVAHQWDSDYFNRALQSYNANTDAYRYGQDRNDRNFIDDRSYGTNLWNTQQNRQDNVFSEDRGFQADRFDQGTSNLFALTGVGANAAAGTANAGNVFANNTINNNNARANTTANAAIANSQNMSNLFGSAAGAVGTYYGSRGLR